MTYRPEAPISWEAGDAPRLCVSRCNPVIRADESGVHSSASMSGMDAAHTGGMSGDGAGGRGGGVETALKNPQRTLTNTQLFVLRLESVISGTGWESFTGASHER